MCSLLACPPAQGTVSGEEPDAAVDVLPASGAAAWVQKAALQGAALCACLYVESSLRAGCWRLLSAACLDTAPRMCAESGCTRRPRKLRPQRWRPATQRDCRQPRARAVRLWRVAQCGPGSRWPQAWAHRHRSCGAARDQPRRGSWCSCSGDDGAHPAEAGCMGHPDSCRLAGPAGPTAAGSCRRSQRGPAAPCTCPGCCCCWP